MARHIRHGRSPEQARAWVEHTDEPNAVGIASGRQALPGSGASAGAVRVLVQGVQSFDDYAGVFAALAKAQEVRDVQLQSYVGDVLTELMRKYYSDE